MPTSPDSAAGSATEGPRFGPPTPANPLWRVVIAAGLLFCLSCLLWITAGFANPEAPGNRWLNQHGLILVVVTGVATVSSAFAAMTTDAIQTRRMQSSIDAMSPGPEDGRRNADRVARSGGAEHSDRPESHP